MRRISKRRQAEQRIYLAEREKFLKENPFCKIKSPVCTVDSSVVHHARGRIGKRYLNKKEWFASCFSCNDYLEKEKKWGIENGFRLDRTVYEQ